MSSQILTAFLFLVGVSGFEPRTMQASAGQARDLCDVCGRWRTRTSDPRNVNAMLYQLS